MPLTDDRAEQVQEAIKKVTGVRGEGCPWWAANDPFTIAVSSARRHWIKGELAQRIGRIPEALMRGIEVFDAALDAVQGHDAKQIVQHDPEPQRPMRGMQIRREPVHAGRRAKP